MHIIAVVFFFALWLYIQARMGRAGINPISRSQMRYLKKKARNLNMDIDSVPYNPRNITITQPENDGITEGQKKLVFYVRALAIILWSIIILIFVSGFKYVKDYFPYLWF
ncbi:hypothetical protein PY793_09870 [Acetobacter fabarum]|uniref:hypothetical protein n=1 Tax=Acetobacter fabarum TaxID=483199 RepID=UPI00312B880D